MDAPRLEIVPDNRRRVYFPGHPVTGQVTLDLTHNILIKELRIDLTGSGYCEWKTKSHEAEGGKFSDAEEYCCLTQILYDRNSAENSELPKGHHRYTLSFTIPEGAPSSFEGATCYVRYVLTASVDFQSGSTRRMFMPISVANLLDLNKIEGQNLLTAVEVTDKTTLRCLCLESNFITATLKMERTGYVPGEAIVFNAEIKNLSNRRVRRTKVQLEMIVTFKASKGRFQSVQRQKLGKIVRGPIFSNRYDVYLNESLVIPPLPPTYLTGCNIIDVDYRLALVVFLPGCSSSLRVYADVIIGGIPLAEIATQHGVTLPGTCPPPAPSNRLTLPPIKSTSGTSFGTTRRSSSPAPTHRQRESLTVQTALSSGVDNGSPSPIAGQLSMSGVSTESPLNHKAHPPSIGKIHGLVNPSSSETANTTSVPGYARSLTVPTITSLDGADKTQYPKSHKSINVTTTATSSGITHKPLSQIPGQNAELVPRQLSSSDTTSPALVTGFSRSLTVPTITTSGITNINPIPKSKESPATHMEASTISSGDHNNKHLSPIPGQSAVLPDTSSELTRQVTTTSLRMPNSLPISPRCPTHGMTTEVTGHATLARGLVSSPLPQQLGTASGLALETLQEVSRLSTRSPTGLNPTSPFTHLLPQATFVESTTVSGRCGLTSGEEREALEGFVPKYIRYTWKHHDPTELFTVTPLRRQHTTLSRYEDT